MARYFPTLVLISFFGIFGYSQEIGDKLAVRDAAVSMLTKYNAEFSVAFKKDNEEGLIYLFPCEDNIEVMIDRNLRDEYQILVDIKVVYIDLERTIFLRKITFKVFNKAAADRLNESFIKPFRKVASCTAV